MKKRYKDTKERGRQDKRDGEGKEGDRGEGINIQGTRIVTVDAEKGTRLNSVRPGKPD